MYVYTQVEVQNLGAQVSSKKTVRARADSESHYRGGNLSVQVRSVSGTLY